MPRVSIGMPVYNSEATIRGSLASLQAQSFSDYELLISDNASTDGTGEICREAAARDPRIRYVRQSSNCGPLANFNYVFDNTTAPYFMWAAGDDVWPVEFIERNARVLDERPDVVASICRTVFKDGATPIEYDAGTWPLLGTPRENVEQYLLRGPKGNSRFYSLFRREVVARAIVRDMFWATDWYFVLRTLRFGGYYEVEDCVFERSARGTSSNVFRALRTFNGHNWTAVAFPLAKFTTRVLRDRNIPKSPRVALALLRHNAEYVRVLVNAVRA